MLQVCNCLVLSVKLLFDTPGLALSLCPALRLCKGKCLPNRCGRLTPPQAALPCGPPVSFADSPPAEGARGVAQQIPIISFAEKTRHAFLHFAFFIFHSITDKGCGEICRSPIIFYIEGLQILGHALREVRKLVGDGDGELQLVGLAEGQCVYIPSFPFINKQWIRSKKKSLFFSLQIPQIILMALMYCYISLKGRKMREDISSLSLPSLTGNYLKALHLRKSAIRHMPLLNPDALL